MKKIYLLLLLVAGFVNAQIVNIPDVNFKNKLIALGVDSNGDGNIQNTEAEALTSLNVSDNAISDLSGIEAFVNLNSLACESNSLSALNVDALIGLTMLSCNSNQINTLNVSTLVNLTSLSCASNNLSTLDLSQVTNLTYLWCSSNHLSTLDVTPLVNLNYLSCGSNQMAALDVTPLANLNTLFCSVNQISFLNLAPLVNLTELHCNYNNLTSLDLSSMSLTELDCDNNLLTTLDVSNSPNLLHLDCSFNQLTTLDLSAQTSLIGIECQDNQLTTLFLKNGHVDYMFEAYNNPLVFVCADEDEFIYVNNFLETFNILNVSVNSYCSFVPGGGYNTVTGIFRFDADNNGCDTDDLLMSNIKLKIDNGIVQGTTLSNTQGIYSFYPPSGNFTLTPLLERPDYFVTSPITATATLPSLNETVTQDFCIVANGVHPDLEIVLMPIGVAHPGFDAYYSVIYKNKGNQTISGSVNVVFDDAKTDFVSASPSADSQTTNTIVWNFTNLRPFETNEIYFALNVNSPLEDPAVNLGDVLDFTATINFVEGDETPQDNIFQLQQTVLNSFDPNAKTCLEGANVLPEHIGKYLHYNINFENTGTADAINIVVKDTIDTTRFDINSLQLLYASHPVYTKITGNIVEFIFENINLPPSIANPIGGHGNVLFKIKTLPTLTIGDEVSNTANIYFDYNTPIDTNEARTAFNNLSKSDFVKDDSVTMYPNPAKNKVTVKAAGTIKSVQLYDVQGRILQSVADGKSQITLDIANQQQGVYFLRITTDKGSAVEKIIKD